jgi:hypothetical protein
MSVTSLGPMRVNRQSTYPEGRLHDSILNDLSRDHNLMLQRACSDSLLNAVSVSADMRILCGSLESQINLRLLLAEPLRSQLPSACLS